MRKAHEIATAFAPREALADARRLFLVGIGGAGMSAVARLARDAGYEVRGSDSTDGPETRALREEGFDVTIGHRAVEGEFDALVLTDAVDLDESPEVASARAAGRPLFRRSQLLGWLLRSRRVVAVTGTHGKTTTTGLVGAALANAGLDPLVVVGAAVPDFGGPVRHGSGEWAVVEACEAYDAFHDLDPDVIVLTNLEPDHLDYHGTWENLRASVARFADRLRPGGKIVYCADDPGASDLAAGRPDAFPYRHREFVGLTLPGRHNETNAAAALAVAYLAGADPDLALAGALAFRGAERRLQVIADGDVTVVDDYAHHPTEIEASIQALRARYPGRRIVVAFQPHLYSRTAEHLEGFAHALSAADLLFVTDIYPAREAPIPGVSSARIVEGVTTRVRYVPSKRLLARTVARAAEPGDVVVGMGAGDVARFAGEFVAERATERRRIVVLRGGDNAEREVSLLSGRAVAAALRSRGWTVDEMDATETLFTGAGFGGLVGPERPYCVFLAVHGVDQEDGSLQGLMRLLHLPFTGSDLLASALAMDKGATKRTLAAAGLETPCGRAFRRDEPVEWPWTGPVVVKPNANGSTIGLTFVDDPAALAPAVTRALDYDEAALVEERIVGMEISIPVFEGRALPSIEIVPASGAYDFAAKYTPGATDEIIPARLPESVLVRAADAAERAHVALGCAGASRTDLIVERNPDGGWGRCVILETNTLPGMTGTSLLPASAAAAGIPFPELCERLIEDAVRRHEAKEAV